MHPNGTATTDTTAYVVNQAMLVLTPIKEHIEEEDEGEDEGEDTLETYNNEIPGFRDV